MTNKEWEELEKSIGMFRPQKLLIDGHKIDIYLKQVSKMKLGFVVYVDGWIKGEYINEDNPIAKKFYWRRETSVWSKKQIKKVEKIRGKIRAKELGMYKKVVYYSTYFKSFSTLKRTFIQNNDSIEWVKES